MSVAQKMRSTAASKVANAMKNQIFANQQGTPQESMIFMKKLLAMAISNIAYMRALFPETAFGDRIFEEIPLKILRDDPRCPGGCGLVKWMYGCFDAIEKKYLRELILAVYTDPNDENTVIESYTFQFGYKDELTMDVQRNNERIVLAQAAKETKHATVSLLRTLIVLMQTLPPFPGKVMVTIKLLYYDDVTPEDYHPVGFKAGNADSFKYSILPVKIKVGEVSTPFHTLNLRVKVDSAQFQEANVGTGEDNEQEQQQQQPAAASQVIGQPALPSSAENDGSLGETEASQTPSKPPHVSSSATQLPEAEGLSSEWIRPTATPVAVKLEAPTSIRPLEPDEIIDLTDSPRARLCPLDRIEDITRKTKQMAVTKNRIFKSRNCDQDAATDDMEIHSMLNKRCLKRVRSLKIETDFELDSSPPSQEDSVYRRVKPRRGSIPDKPLCV